MRINEIITEDMDLEEGWKSKLGAAALAGAAALGGGPADAGGGMTLTVVGKTYDSQGNAIVKYQDGSTRNLGTNEWTSPTMAQQRRNQALAKQKADREAAARAASAARVANVRASQQSTAQQPAFDPTQDPFLMDVTGQINKDISKFKSDLESNPTASEKTNLIKQIDSRLKDYFDHIEEVIQSRGVSKEEKAYLDKKMQQLGVLRYDDALVIKPGSNNTAKSGSSTKNDDENIRGGAAGAQQYDQDSKLTNTLIDYVKSFKKDNPNMQAAVTKFGSSGLDKFQKSFDYFQKNQNTIKTMELESDYDDSLKELDSLIKDYKSYLNKSDYKQDQTPTASQSPKAPVAKQVDANAGWSAKTTGKATGVTKNGDQYTGNWVDGLANGSGERTLVNNGYTGGLVKTGNKLDTEWKNGMPVDGAKVKITRPDGTVFNGHIKRGDENPWGYMIVK